MTAPMSYINTIKGRLVSNRSGYLLAIAAAVLTGMVHSLPKQFFSLSPSGAELNPLTFVAIVYIINGVFFTPMKKSSAPISKIGRRNLFIILAIALAEVSGLVAYFFGLKQSTAINGSILTNGEIIFAVLIAVTIFKERLNKKEIIPFSAIIAGIIALPIGYEFFQSHLSVTDLLLGNLLILLSGAFCAIDVVLCRYVTDKVDAKRITQIVSFAGAGFVLATMAIFQVPFQVDLAQLPSIALIGLFGTGFATFLFLVALKMIGTTRTVLLYSTNFIFGIIFATVFIHESLTFINIASIILSSIGIYLLRNKIVTIKEFLSPAQTQHKRGSYKSLCGTCQTNDCCTSFSSPLLFPKDIEKLKEIGKYDDEHVKKIQINEKTAETIKKKNNSTQCIFWDQDSRKCSIYKNRPFDCMIYPFDIFKMNGKYFWIVYTCNPHSNWEWSESHLQMFENSKEFAEIIENIDIYSHIDFELQKKIKNTKYSVIREVTLVNHRTNNI